MKAIISMVLCFFAVIASVKTLGIYLDHQQAADNKARHEARAVAEDKRLSDACDKGQTGIVIYYKGKHC